MKSKPTSSFRRGLALLITNWQIVVIMVVATLLRTWQLDTKAILFGDAAHDLLVADQAVDTGRFPLLGIASSVPRFKQGPLTVWLEMMINLVGGEQMYVYSLVFALISLAAVVAVYEYGAIYLSKTQALLAALLVATSPLAVAHGRVVYHITPIPIFMVLYLFSLVNLWQKKSKALFWAVLAWCGLFQFELALLPAILAIPYVLWRTKPTFHRGWIKQAGLAFLIGLAPQLIYDVMNRFSQLGGFAVWVGYRVVSTFGLVGDHALNPGKFGQTLSLLWLYLGRVVSSDQIFTKVVMVLITLVAVSLLIHDWRKRKLAPAMEIVTIVSSLLLAGFVIHSAPSEAYFPPFIVCLPMIISYVASRLNRSWAQALAGLLVAIAVLNVVGIFRHSFFVSNTQAFSYGPSVAEQREIVQRVNHASQGSFRFATTQPGGKYPSYFDNLRWLGLSYDLSETDQGALFYIEPKNSELGRYPGMRKMSLPSVDIYQIPSL